MKPLEGDHFDRWRDRSQRVIDLYGHVGDKTCGSFRVPIIGSGVMLTVHASSGFGWDHVSVSLPYRCPTWEEMVRVKRAFFNADEWVMELHPPQTLNISLHPYTLHLWRPQLEAIPLPKEWMV